MRRVLSIGSVALALQLVALPASARTTTTTTPRGNVPVVVIDGRGWGHGVGMAQDGIYWMAKANAKTTTAQILSTFYPGTTIGKSAGTVRVVVHAPPTRAAVIAFPNGGRIDAGGEPGFPLVLGPGESVQVGNDGARYWAARVAASKQPPARGSTGTTGSTTTSSTTTSSASSTSTTFDVPGGPTSAGEHDTTVPPPSASSTSTSSTTTPTGGDRDWSNQPLRARPTGGGTVTVADRNRTFRGVLDIRLDSAGVLRFVNELDVEAYLKGMGEVRDSRWPAAALRAQAIAARTYALRAMAAGGEICDDQRCQVYLGAQAEYAAMNKAVADTASQVVLYKGRLASTVYSANAGGHSATREEGFGTTGDGYPYLRAAPYTTKDQLPWTVRATFSDVAARLGYAGRISAVSVLQYGPSGRALQVAVDGSAGRMIVPGRTFDARLGLKSTLFKLRVEQAKVAPPALPPAGTGPAGEMQALPEEAVTLPPRPPDPPLPAELDRRDDTPQESVIVGEAAAAVAPPYETGTSNSALALFVILVLAGVVSVVRFGRRPRSG